MAKKIKATAIFEVLGRPKEHLVESLKELLEAISKEKGLKITSKKIHEPKEFENKNGQASSFSKDNPLFTTFSEVDVEADGVMNMIKLCFGYMPAHVEITEPEDFSLNNSEINSILNELILKLHNYDAIAKSAIINNKALANQIQALRDSREQKTENKDAD